MWMQLADDLAAFRLSVSLPRLYSSHRRSNTDICAIDRYNKESETRTDSNDIW